jgi:predicted regulator of Ras-like GTPase activity (Roadblock/LC7/MglB family)
MADHFRTRSSYGSANDLGWLLKNFVQNTVGAVEAVAVSADGFLLASSDKQRTGGAEKLSAVISGITSLSRGAAELYDYGELRQVIIEMRQGYFFVMSINDGSTFGVLADAGCDVGQVGYEMALLIERVGAVLTPQLIEEMKNAIPLQPQQNSGG